MRTLSFIFIACLSGFLAGCSKPEAPSAVAEQTPGTPAVASPPREEAPVAPVDACALLTSDEVEAVQGEPVKETKPGEKTDRGLVIYDCFVMLPTFSNSVSLSVAQRGPESGSRSVMEVWTESFVSPKDQPKSGPPRKIAGSGDDAYWLGDERIGALFVLKGSRYLRISVGGPGNQDAKIEKCRRLAEFAITRM